MNPILFVGPTLYGHFRTIPQTLDLRPPARCGDVLKAVAAGARTIGLIDGLFGDCRSVWHKEILHAIAEGVQVYGAASMGALRAAECAPYGMIGVGKIFRAYHDGTRLADADVAVLHGPQEMNFMPLTVALVDAEAAIDNLYQQATLQLPHVTALLAAARGLNFRRRTWSAILAAAGLADACSADIAIALQDPRQGQKVCDALTLTKMLAETVVSPYPTPVVKHPDSTIYFERLRATLKC